MVYYKTEDDSQNYLYINRIGKIKIKIVLIILFLIYILGRYLKIFGCNINIS